VVNGYNTDLTGLYIESYEEAGLRLRRIHSSVHLDQINVKGSKSGGHAIEITEPSLAAVEPTVNVGAVNILHEHAVKMTALHNSSSEVNVKLAGLTIAGPEAGLVTRLGGEGAQSVRTVDNARILGEVRESVNQRTLSLEGIPLILGNCDNWAGPDEQEVSLKIAALTDFDRWEGIVTVSAAKDHDKGQSCVWVAHLLVTCKESTDPWRTYVTDMVPASGFLGSPRVSADKASSGATLTVTFTPTAPDGYGVVSLMSVRV
jgi:hypothetical protein